MAKITSKQTNKSFPSFFMVICKQKREMMSPTVNIIIMLTKNVFNNRNPIKIAKQKIND